MPARKTAKSTAARRTVSRSRNHSKVIEVSAGLVFRKGKLLISQRRDEDHLGGLWEFPGGKRHADESFEACLSRELLEELAIEVKVGALIETLEHAYAEKTVLLKFFKCRWIAREPQALGCQAFAWIGRGELADYEFPKADQRVLARLMGDDQLWLE